MPDNAINQQVPISQNSDALSGLCRTPTSCFNAPTVRIGSTVSVSGLCILWTNHLSMPAGHVASE